MIGLLLLMGIVKKNSIILVDYANEVRHKDNLDAAESMRRAAARSGLRPILMTAVATMMAAVPSAMGLGPGAETRGPMADAIIGGLILSTLLSLFVVPAFYVIADRILQWQDLQGRRRQGRAGNGHATQVPIAPHEPQLEDRASGARRPGRVISEAKDRPCPASNLMDASLATTAREAVGIEAWIAGVATFYLLLHGAGETSKPRSDRGRAPRRRSGRAVGTRARSAAGVRAHHRLPVRVRRQVDTVVGIRQRR